MVQYPKPALICYRRHRMVTQRLRVAVVDDDASVRKALKRLLRVSDLDVEVFVSAQDFLESLPSRHPDCLVLDLHMPGTNGLDLQHHLARVGVRVPVVVITGHDEPQTRAQCELAGAAAFLCKPLDEKALLQAIQQATGAPRSRPD